MCFGSRSKERGDALGPRPVQSNGQSASDAKASYPQQQQLYAPPPGPPPSQQQYAPPPGPPPQSANEYAPPPGPPPTQVHDFAPPPGPPPSQEPKPQHDWEKAVPDTSLFPPPPAFFSGWDRSPANNATNEEAENGARWCKEYPLTPPITLDMPSRSALQHHEIQLMQPWGFTGELSRKAAGLWECRTRGNAPDSCIIGYPPLYTVTEHSPLATGVKRTVYYEVQVDMNNNPWGGEEEVPLALGFTALPYPNFRLPGWHRGSMAVHGDDGHRYVNDTWGGQSFTKPFRRGERLGVGMTFEAVEGRIVTECFFTRDGVLDGKWDLHEEQDVDVNLPVEGLEGFHDLSCAVGTFKETSFEVIFDPAKWRYRPT